MKSIFTKPREKYLVTYYVVELIESAIAQKGEDAPIDTVIPPVLKRAGYPPPYESSEVLDFIKALDRMKQVKSEKTGTGGPKSDKRTFGADFYSWVGSLSIDEALLKAVGYNYGLAEEYYKTLPYEAVDKIIELDTTSSWHQLQGVFEAVVIGMGGSLGKVQRETGDLQTKEGVKKMETSLKGLGF